ncbi:high affinity immunoglobulin alpha and immunoglobulin mu Fc receptor isoform X2 [Marmota monax]|uniref:high affinity immunoglobulin alpha and immunoglobulin mu Fc receptor isoform X2 n=1 Tax=Marmota monax TaxID=9995 RepID=UPI001EAFE6B9|nr:high affinity immunoglobulin alpha and immunoglobulin mu Fc receptor isoform X2 [Marmota monax]
MDGKAPRKPREQKVIHQGAGWKMPLLLVLCLLQAANTLKGPKLVAGKPGGAVTIQCHYTPSSANRHQRKYWCRLQLPTRICHTIVSSNHYTHRDYQGRVTLADFPQSSLFVVRLSQLSLHDVGQYRCGIGDRNNRLFLNMNLTVSAGPSETIPTATSAAGELVTTSFETGSPASNRWIPGATHTLGQGTEWDRVTSTSGTSKITTPAKGRQTPATAWEEALETGSGAEGSIKATVPAPESPASKPRSVFKTTESVQEWGTYSLVTNTPRASESGKERTTEADRAGQETDRVRTEPDAARRTTGTMRPSAPVSEQLAQETLREATPVSRQQALGSTEGATPPTGMWTLDTTSTEAASVEGSTYGDLHSTVGYRGPQAMPSQAPATGPQATPSQTPATGPQATPSQTPAIPTQAPVTGPQTMLSRTPVTGPQATPSQTPVTGPQATPSQTPVTGPQATPSQVPAMPTQAPVTGPQATPSQTPATGPQATPSQTPATGPQATPSQIPVTGPQATPSQTPATGPQAKPSQTPATGPQATPSQTPATGPQATPSQTPATGPQATPSQTPAPGSQATPSQAPATGPLKPPGMESSMKSAFPEVESSFQILTPVCTVLAPFLIVALVLLQRKLQGNGPSQEAEKTPRVTLIQMTHFLESTLSPAHLSHEERKTLQGDSPTQADPTAPERNPGLSGMEK